MGNDPNTLEWVAAIAPAVAILFTIPALRLAAASACGKDSVVPT